MSWMLLVFSVFINIQEILVKKLELSWASYLDEVLLILPYFLVPFIVRRREDSWVYIVLILPFISVAYSLVFNSYAFGEYRFLQVLVQSLINFKLFFYFTIFYCVWLISPSARFRFLHIFMVCISISIIGYMLNIFYPDFFLFSDASWHLDRDRIAGFQFKPNDLALLLSFSCFLVLFSRLGWLLKLLFFIFILILIYYTSSRTALAFALVAFFLYLIRVGSYLFVLGSALFVTCGVILFFDELLGSFFISETISNFGEFYRIEESQYIRAIMIYLSFVLAIDYFPVGVGAGGFGSVMSGGSPVYEMLGVADSGFFIELQGIYDSGLASILGEYGLLGLSLYLFVFWKIVRTCFGGNSIDAFILVLLVFMLLLVQPVFSYQVNSINLLLMLFSLKELEFKHAKAKES